MSAREKLSEAMDQANINGERETIFWNDACYGIVECLGLTILSCYDKELKVSQVWIPKENLPLLIECAQRELSKE